MTTGFAAIQLIEAMVDGQVRSATLDRDQFAKLLASQIGQVFGGNLDPERQGSLFKALRMKNPLNERLIAENLPWIPSDLPDSFKEELNQVEKLSADAHQARTQAAFVSGVLKPFNPKILQRWADERTDVDVSSYAKKIEYLQEQNLVRVDQLIGWGDDVAELFKELVVVDETGDDLISRKPFGTVSRQSSRTYVQSWLAFIRRHSNQILQGKVDSAISNFGMEANRSSAASPIASRIGHLESAQEGPSLDRVNKGPTSDYSKSEVDGDLSEAAALVKKLERENKSLRSLSSSAIQAQQSVVPIEEKRATSSEIFKPGLTIYAEAASGEKSSCYFENIGSAQLGISMWVDTLQQIWSDQTESVKFRAEVRIGSEQLAFDLPRFALEEASQRLMIFAQRLAGIQNPQNL